MKKFEDLIKELLENGGMKQEDADALTEARNAHTKILNEENKTLRTENETLIEEATNAKSALDSEMVKLEEKIAEAKKSGEAEVVSKLESEISEKQELQKKYDDAQKKNNSYKLDKIVATALKDFDVKNEHKEDTEFRLRSKVSLNDKGEAVFKDGSNEISVEDGFKTHFEANEFKLKPKGENGGSGSGEQSGSSDARKYFDKTSNSFSLTKQGEIFKSNPSLYKQLKG